MATTLSRLYGRPHIKQEARPLELIPPIAVRGVAAGFVFHHSESTRREGLVVSAAGDCVEFRAAALLEHVIGGRARAARGMADYTPYVESIDHGTIEFHVAFLVSFLKFLDGRGIGTPGQLQAVTGRKFLSEPLWKLGEANKLPNRKHNLRFYSEQAHCLAFTTNVVPTSRKKHGVEHEHVIPRKLLEARLLTNRTDGSEIRRLAGFAVGCIVSVSEHKLLPRDPWGAKDPTSDPWRRYRDGGVRVWDRKTSAWVDLTREIPK